MIFIYILMFYFFVKGVKVVSRTVFHSWNKNESLNDFLGRINYNIGEKVLLAGDIGVLGKELRLAGVNVTILENTNYEDVCYALVHNENCNFVKGNLEYLPFANNYFDKVIVMEQFNCIGNYKKASLEISRVLKDDGELILEDFDLNNIKNKMRYVKRKICGLCGNHFYPSDIKDIFSELSFDGYVEAFNNYRYLYIAKKRV